MDLSRFSILSVVVIFIFVFDYIGTLPLYFSWDAYRVATGVTDKMRILTIFAITSWALFSMVLGYAVTATILGTSSKNSVTRPLITTERWVVILLFVLCLMVLGVYLLQISRIALVAAVTDGKAAAEVARSNMTNNFPGKYHWYKLIMVDLLNVLAFTSYANYLANKRLLSLCLFIPVVAVAVFVSVMATEKAPFVFLVIGLFFTNVQLRSDGRYPIGRSLVMGSIAFLALIVFYLVFMGSRGFDSAVWSVFSRAFTGQISPAYYYLQYFPRYHSFLMGSSFPDLGGILTYKPYNLPVEIMSWKFPELAQQGIVGSAPTIFWGEMYANFGYFGALISPIFVGVGLCVVTAVMNKLENTPLRVGMMAWLALHYKNLAITGLSAFTNDFYLILIAMIWIMAIFAANRGILRYYRPR